MTLFAIFVLLGFVLKVASFFPSTRIPEWTAWASWLAAAVVFLL